MFKTWQAARWAFRLPWFVRVDAAGLVPDTMTGTLLLRFGCGLPERGQRRGQALLMPGDWHGTLGCGAPAHSSARSAYDLTNRAARPHMGICPIQCMQVS
jgi:hypothetical protein